VDRDTQCSLLQFQHFPQRTDANYINIYKIHDCWSPQSFKLRNSWMWSSTANNSTWLQWGWLWISCNFMYMCASACTSAVLLFLAMRNTTKYRLISSSKEGKTKNGLKSSTLIWKCCCLFFSTKWSTVCIYIKAWHNYTKIDFQHYLAPWSQMSHVYRLSSLVATMVSYAISSGSRTPKKTLDIIPYVRVLLSHKIMCCLDQFISLSFHCSNVFSADNEFTHPWDQD
jgi:hypothetical protein